MRRHTRPRRLALAAAVLTIAGGAHPARSVDTSGSPPNRTSFATATVVNPALGRPISGGATTLAIDLVAPGEVWGDRVNEFDLRFGKILKFGRMRTNVGIDIYNVLNQAAVLTYNQTFAPAPGQWLAPTAVLTPRFMKVSAQIDF